MRDMILKYMPSPVLDVLCTLEGIRLNRKRYTKLTEKYYQWYLQSDAWSEEKLIEFQNMRLREIVAYCAEHTPYYRKYFAKSGIDPKEIKRIDDLPRLPYLDKSIIRKSPELFISDEYDEKSLDMGRTGGTTGTPVKIYFSPETWPAQYGFFWARWRPGVKRGQRYACFQGQNLVPFNQTRPPFWRTNYVSKQRLFSVFHLNEKNLPAYYDSLNQFQPKYIQGYPSAMYIVAEYMQRKNLHFNHPVKAAFSMSETVQPVHKKTIENAWECQLWDQYGQGERVASITLRECGYYHYDMDFGIIEFEKIGEEDGLSVAEIVGTSLMNKAWTLIRYRTGDLALIDTERKCSCGRPGPKIHKIFGRTGDILTMPDGRIIMNITTAVKDIPGLLEFQIVHEKPTLVIVNVVKGEGYTDRSDEMIRRRMVERLGTAVTLEFKYMQRVERTQGGKYKAILSKV
jgi:phenylacetate-CoA ligase